MKVQNYYQILGVDPFATQEEVKRAYLSCLKEYHPDKRMGHNTFAYKRFQAVMEAYEAIKTPEKRATYDRILTLEISAQEKKSDLQGQNDNTQQTKKTFWNLFKQPEKKNRIK